MVIHQTEEFSSNGLETLTSQSVLEYQTTNHLESFGTSDNQQTSVVTSTNHLGWKHQPTIKGGNIK